MSRGEKLKLAAANNEPLSFNYQEAQNFAFNVKRLPAVSYFCKTFHVPGLTLPPAKAPSPSLMVPFIGDHIVYEPLSLSFRVDTNLQNWLEIHNWLTAIGNPTNNGKQFKNLEQNGIPSPYTIYSDITAFKMDSQRNPVFEFTFKNAWPTSLSGLDFDSSDPDVKYIEATATFSYVRYTFSSLISPISA